jgi:hypothetical protein
MSSAPRQWWQFSLAELLIITSVVAAVAAMIKVMGWGILCLAFHPLMLMVYIAIYIERRLRVRIKQQRAERKQIEDAAALKRRE